jgi:hypothetical protein
VSTIFIFESPQFQNACNTIYQQKEAYDLEKNAVFTGKTYKFKSDLERIQYKLGLLNQNPSCQR